MLGQTLRETVGWAELCRRDGDDLHEENVRREETNSALAGRIALIRGTEGESGEERGEEVRAGLPEGLHVAADLGVSDDGRGGGESGEER